jgi:hypothetical protein
MEVRVFKPQNEKLKQYIECFYTLKNSKNTSTSYITFPSIYTIVAILTNASFELNNHQITTKESTSSKFASSLVAHFQNPIVFAYKGLSTKSQFILNLVGSMPFWISHCLLTTKLISTLSIRLLTMKLT